MALAEVEAQDSDGKWSFLSSATLTTSYHEHSDEIRVSVLGYGIILNARPARMSPEDMRTLAGLLNEGADVLEARRKEDFDGDGA